MSNDLNQCQFIGRLGKDPETRYTPSGKAVTSFSIAVGSSWKDANGEKQESTEWVSVSAFDKLAEICGEYLKKGSQVFISGRLKTEKYQKDGQDRYITKIIADRMQMLGGKQESEAPAPRPAKTHGDRPGGPKNRYLDGAAPPPKGTEPQRTGFDDIPDDIPF